MLRPGSPCAAGSSATESTASAGVRAPGGVPVLGRGGARAPPKQHMQLFGACLCWAEDDEAAIDAAAAKTAATADLMPCSMAVCSEQGGLDDKATEADGVFAVSGPCQIDLPAG